MQLILAIDSDPRRSEQLAVLVRSRLEVDLVQATSAGEGLHALKDRVPDLILTSPLLSPFDDGVLDEYLRDLGSAATHVQTVRIPMLSSGPKKKSAARRLFSLGRKKTKTSSATPDGCDPKVFADEIAHYLTRSLEQRTASTKTTSAKASAVEAPSAPEEWGAPEALVNEFIAPVLEGTHVPGSILNLRPAVHAPQITAVDPEPPLEVVQGSPARSEPELLVDAAQDGAFDAAQDVSFDSAEDMPAFVEPVMAVAEHEPATYVEPVVQPVFEPTPSFDTAQSTTAYAETVMEAAVDPEPPFDSAQGRPFDSAQGRPTSVEPAPPVVAAPSVVEPAAPSTPAPGTSASFEAALAAIRAAWVKPEAKTSAPSVPAAPVGGAKPLSGSNEVDLTNEIDALEDVTALDGTVPAADNHNSPDESAPDAQRRTEKPKKRPEKPRGRKTRGPDGRDDWGVFDPNQCEFSTLVNKLEEVTDSDEVTTRVTNGR